MLWLILINIWMRFKFCQNKKWHIPVDSPVVWKYVIANRESLETYGWANIHFSDFDNF